jgi:hypothetical protein
MTDALLAATPEPEADALDLLFPSDAPHPKLTLVPAPDDLPADVAAVLVAYPDHAVAPEKVEPTTVRTWHQTAQAAGLSLVIGKILVGRHLVAVAPDLKKQGKYTGYVKSLGMSETDARTAIKAADHANADWCTAKVVPFTVSPESGVVRDDGLPIPLHVPSHLAATVRDLAALPSLRAPKAKTANKVDPIAKRWTFTRDDLDRLDEAVKQDPKRAGAVWSPLVEAVTVLAHHVDRRTLSLLVGDLQAALKAKVAK